jgi:phage tail-like protein
LKETGQFFSLIRAEDFQKGFLYHLDLSDKGLRISPEYAGSPYVFYSEPFDSLKKGTAWQRTLLDADIPANAWIKLSWLASDNVIIRTPQGYQAYMDYLQTPGISMEEKERVLTPLFQQSAVNARDFLLNAQGRYLFLRTEMFGFDEYPPFLRQIRVYFDVPSLLRYLPEIYSMDSGSSDFLKRYLSIFQSLWMDMEQSIDQIPRLFDPDVAPYPFLLWISSWMAVHNPQFWQEDKLRRLLKKIPLLYKIKGTRRSIGEIVELYTGESCYIVEPHEAGELAAGAGHLYGAEMDPFTFLVFVNENQLPGEKERAELKWLVDSFKPAHTEARLIFLRSHIHLGSHSYLGINSFLIQPGPFKLDGSAAFGALDLAVLGKSINKEEIVHEEYEV